MIILMYLWTHQGIVDEAILLLSLNKAVPL